MSNRSTASFMKPFAATICLMMASSLAHGQTWQSPIGDDWNMAANWAGGVFPDSVGATATFDVAPVADATIDLTAGVTIGTLDFANANNITFTGSAFTFDATAAGPAALNVTGSGGTGSLTFSTASIIAVDALTFNVTTGVPTGLTVMNTATITNGGAGMDLTFTGTGNSTIDGVISGDGGFNMNGTGIVTLGATNTYTGTTTVNSGTLQLNTADAIADANAVVTANVAGATLALLADETIGSLNGGGANGGDVVLGTFTLTTGGANGTDSFGGAISGTGGLTKMGTDTMTLSGTNTYSGTTNINAGILSVSGGNALDDASAVVLMDVAGAALNLVSNESIGSLASATGINGGNVTLGANTLTAGGNGDNTTFAGAISGTGGFTKAGGGLMFLSGTNTYTGATTINGGILTILGGNAIADTSAVVLADAAGVTLIVSTNETIGSLSGGGTTGGNVTLGNSLTTGGNNATTIYSGALSSTGNLTKAGTGTMTLNGNNTFTGTTTVMAGTLLAASDMALGDVGTGTVVNTGAELQLSGGINVGAEALSITGTGITTNGALFNLAGTNTFGGVITLPTAAATIGAATGTTLNLTGNIMNNANLLTIDSVGTGSVVQANTSIINGTAGLTATGTGPTILNGTNTYSGLTTISAGSIVTAGNDTALGAVGVGNGTTVISGGTLALGANVVNVAEDVTINGSGVAASGALSNTTGTANTYSGAITLGSDATISNLFQPGLFTISGGINIVGNNLTFAGDGSTTVNTIGITGMGGLIKNGILGTLTLGVTNTYGGTTTINQGIVSIDAADRLGTLGTGIIFGGGTLNLSADLNLTDAVTLNAGGGTIDTASGGTSTFSGVFSGTGGLTKTGVGTLSLSATNTYAGTTTANAGILQFTGDTSMLGGNIVDNAAVVFNQAANSSFGNVISGAGTVTKAGAGTLSFTGANTYTGATIINGGRLDVNGSITSNTTVNTGAILGGTGTITGNVTVATGGTMAPGNSIGVTNVVGTFNQNTGSTFQLEVAPVTPGSEVAGTSHDQVNVTGNAAIQTGTTVQVLPAAGTYALGTTFTFLNTTTGVSGAYTTLAGATFNNGILLGSLVTNANNVQLVINQTNFVAAGVTQNQMSVGAGLDMAAPLAAADPTGDAASVINTLAGLTAAPLQTALDEIGAASFGSIRSATIQQRYAHIQSIANRVRALTTRTGIVGGLDFVRGQSPSADDYGWYADDGYWDDASPFYGGGIDLSGWTGWFDGYGGYGELDGNFQAAGLKYRGGGAAVGMHRIVDGSGYQGLSFGYNNTGFRSNNSLNNVNVNNFQAGVYQSHTFGDEHYWMGIANYGYSEYESARRINSLGRIANGEFDGHEFSGYLELGTNTNVMNWEVQPFVGLQYILLGQNNFTETGAGFLNLTVANQQTDSLRSNFGLRIAKSYYGQSGREYAPQFHMRWMREHLGNNTNVASTFAGTNAVFTTQGVNLPKELVVIGIGGTALTLNRDTSLYLGYDVLFGSGQIEHSGNAGFQYEW